MIGYEIVTTKRFPRRTWWNKFLAWVFCSRQYHRHRHIPGTDFEICPDCFEIREAR